MGPLETGKAGVASRDKNSVRFILTLGSALAIAGLVQVYFDPEPAAVQGFEALLVGLPAFGILHGGYWVTSRRLLAEDRWTVATWAVVGSGIGAVLVGGWLVGEWLVGNSVSDGYLLFVIGTLSGGFVGSLATVTTRQPVCDPETAGDPDDRRAAFEPPPSDVDTLATVAADPRLWYTLQSIRSADDPITVERIVSELGTIETESEDELYLDLVHVRLPKLAAYGLVRYDPSVNVVRETERCSAVLAAGDELAVSSERSSS